MFQCIVISVGNGGFNTEEVFDYVKFRNPNAIPGMTLHYLYQWQIYDFLERLMQPLNLGQKPCIDKIFTTIYKIMK